MAQNQHGALLVAGRQPGFDPFAHSVLVGSEQSGDFFHRVAAVDFDTAVIWVPSASFHLRFVRHPDQSVSRRALSDLVLEACFGALDLPPS